MQMKYLSCGISSVLILYIFIYIFYIYFKCQQMYTDTYVSVRPVG